MQVNACFGYAGVFARTCAFGRDLTTCARADRPTNACAFSRDETTGAQMFVVSDMPVDDEKNACDLANIRKSIQLS